MFISKVSKRHQKEAQDARKNRGELIAARLSRRDMIKLGLLTSSGMLVLKHGLSSRAPSKAFAQALTCTPYAVPLTPFTHPMPRIKIKTSVSSLSPAPAEGHVDGDARRCKHQRFEEFFYKNGMGPNGQGKQQYDTKLYEIFQKAVTPDTVRFHPELPYADPSKVWGFADTAGGPASVPGPLYYARYGEASYIRNWNKLPSDLDENGGFGLNKVSTHLHNGHTPSESDGNPLDYYPRRGADPTTLNPDRHGSSHLPPYPPCEATDEYLDRGCVSPIDVTTDPSAIRNKGWTGSEIFYDQHYPNILAGWDTFAAGQGLPNASPTYQKTYWEQNFPSIKGDFRETLSTLWYHDHMPGFTSQNVYKGLAGMYNLYGPLDSGWDESSEPGPLALKLPAGPHVIEGGVDYGHEFDVNIMIGDKVLCQDGQLFMDLFNMDGIIGDYVTVNGAIQPYFEVKRRKYRFRILNAGPSRFYEFFLGDAGDKRTWPFVVISSDGNLLQKPLTMLTMRVAPAERLDVIIDFSKVPPGTKVYLENRLWQSDGNATELVTLPAGDPRIQKLLEFRVDDGPSEEDPSCVPDRMIPCPDRSEILIKAVRSFDFNINANGLWSVNDETFEPCKVSASPKRGDAEVWSFAMEGNWWHPIHVHFEEGQTLSRGAYPIPPEERLGRKDIWKVGPLFPAEVFFQFREFLGRYVIHCHNVVHEDHDMMTQFEIIE